MALRGLSARSVLSERSAVRLALSSTARLRMETHTITKSRHVHIDVKYLQGEKSQPLINTDWNWAKEWTPGSDLVTSVATQQRENSDIFVAHHPIKKRT